MTRFFRLFIPLWLLSAVFITSSTRCALAQSATPVAATDASATDASATDDAATDAVAPDPGGDKTGNFNDVADASAGVSANEAVQKSLGALDKHSMYGPGMQFLTDSVGQNRVGINMAWLLLCGFMVMFMQAGFALVETGFTRAKSACHTMMMNLCIYVIGLLGFWAFGYALMYGAAGGNAASIGGISPFTDGSKVSIDGFGSLFATKGWFLSGSSYDVGVCAMFLFQVVFMDTAATIPTGAMAERWKFSAFIVFGFFMSIILYPIFGHWAWGGGWLSQIGNNFGLGCGYVDFAGSGVVHAVGGLCGLAGAMVLGPRLGKYNRDGTANAIPGHNIPLALLGVLVLGFGWFGFNSGSTFGAAGAGNLRIGIIATTTMMASAGGAFTVMMYMMLRTGKPDPSMVANGFLAGLVAITAPAAFVSPTVGVLIGAIGGLIMVWAVSFLDLVRVDDPVGAVAVHAGAGIWGVLAVGIFADGTYGNGWNNTLVNGKAVPLVGLLHGGTGQFFAQLVGVATVCVWAFGLSYMFFKVQHKIMGIRSSREDELGGLDIPEMGIVAYPPDMVDADNLDEDEAMGTAPAERPLAAAY